MGIKPIRAFKSATLKRWLKITFARPLEDAAAGPEFVLNIQFWPRNKTQLFLEKTRAVPGDRHRDLFLYRDHIQFISDRCKSEKHY